MELKEFTEKTLEMFRVENVKELGDKLLQACADHDLLDRFSEMVEGDLSTDWLQKIYQYYLADRDEKKQDYTPACLAEFMGLLVGDSENVVDLCAGSGALIIQKWNQNHETKFKAVEYDKTVIPFLIFNMVIRNIECEIYHKNALTDDESLGLWMVRKGGKYGCVIDVKPALQHEA